MAKTSFDPKICTIPPQGEGHGGGSPGSPAANTEGPGDIYTRAGANPYRSLVSGARAQTTPSSEMLAEIDRVRTNSREDPMQAFLGNFVMGGGGATAENFDMPVVPLFRKLIKKVPNASPDAIVHKYRALEKMIRTLKNNTEVTLKHPSLGARMTTDEIRAMMAHSKELDSLLIKCREQIKYAEAYRRQREEEEQVVDAG